MSENEESKKKVERWIEENIHGPDEFKQKIYRCYISASVYNNKGMIAHAWLETMESYRFTAVAGVRSVEKLFDIGPTGALTPALAFGEDFILEIPETKRFDSIN
ncbi:MAG: hypothetical protein ACFE94_15710 [Candidatus Hodarchaeota archaeon]